MKRQPHAHPMIEGQPITLKAVLGDLIGIVLVFIVACAGTLVLDAMINGGPR